MIIPVDLGLKTHSLFGCSLIFTLFFGVIRLQLYLASTSKLALASETASHPGGYSWEFLVGVDVPPGSLNPDPFSDEKCHFSHPFSDLASKCIPILRPGR